MMEVFVKLSPGAILPEYKTEGAAGADLFAYIENDVKLSPMERRLIPTGVFVQLPFGYELQVRPRSGLALKYGVTVLNTPGTVDSDYRGELQVLLINFGNEDFVVRNGDRIAQAVITEVSRVSFTVSSSLSQTERGSNGYGSTGI
ncbi:MAG: dUTP diphosphatase [Treponema sp.]